MEHTSLDEAMRLAHSSAEEINTKVQVWVRFPNESCPDLLYLSVSDFQPAITMGTEIFGWLHGNYVAVDREDWSRAK